MSVAGRRMRGGMLAGALLGSALPFGTVGANQFDEFAEACTWATSRTHLSIVGGMLDRLVNSPESGTYVRLLQALAERTPFRFDMEVHSDKRAQRHFTDAHYDAYLIWSNFDPPLSSLKLQISARAVYAFVREGAPVPANITDLEGKSVGLPFVYSFPKSLTENPRIKTMRLAEDAASNLAALSRGRVDVVLVSGGDAEAFLRTHPTDGLAYAPESPILVKETYIIFQENSGLDCTVQMLAAELEKMRTDGSFARIISD
ncbi:MAG: transporter substrate-binding domain-containing protein [Alphaproteobacteria bacterium]|nr:transporter substrate-binding domain-containing protein [Alphaproteobacteria bacterium]